MLKWLNNKKKDNKGFSLVELIIVVAIMAILVGLLAPQYIKYVEKSRKSADASNLSEMVNAAQVYAADADANLAAGTYTITIDSNGVTLGASGGAKKADLQTAIEATAPDYENIVLKSNKWGDTKIKATIVVDPTTGGTTVTYAPTQIQEFVSNAKKTN